MNLPGLALTRLRRDWGLSLIQALGLAAAVALAVVVPLLQAQAAEAGLARTLDQLGSSRYLVIEQFNVRDTATYDQFQAEASRRVQADLGSEVRPGARYAGTSTLRPLSLNGVQLRPDVGDPLPTVSYFEGLAAHAKLAAGAWAADQAVAPDTFGASISSQAAALFGVKLGDVYCMSGSAPIRGPAGQVSQVCAQVSGIWNALDATGDYWAGAPPLASFFLGRDSYFAMAQRQAVSLRGGQVHGPRPGSIDTRNAAAVADHVNRLRGYYEVQRQGVLATGLDRAIRDYVHRTEVAQFASQLVVAALLAIALYAVAFVAGHALFTQRQALAVLSTRGWSGWRLWRLVMLEFAWLLLVAVPAGAAVAWLAVIVLGRTALRGGLADLSPSQLLSLAPTLLATLLAGVVVLAAVSALAVQRGLLDVRRGQSRSGVVPWYRYRNLDLLLAVIAVPLLAESRLRGSGQARPPSRPPPPRPWSCARAWCTSTRRPTSRWSPCRASTSSSSAARPSPSPAAAAAARPR